MSQNPYESFSNVSRELRANAQWAEGAEQTLQANFETWVEGLDLEALIRRNQAPPKKLGRYALIPIVGDEYHASPGDSTFAPGKDLIIPSGVTVEPIPGRLPLYLDNALAIGLTFDGVLRGISSAYISDIQGQVVIDQNQGLVQSKPELGRDNPALRSGLHGGFPWLNPLVQGWATIGVELNSPSIQITSARQNRWVHRLGIALFKAEHGLGSDEATEQWQLLERKEQAAYREKAIAQLRPNYDGVAERLGFKPSPDGNWQQNLR